MDSSSLADKRRTAIGLPESRNKPSLVKAGDADMSDQTADRSPRSVAGADGATPGSSTTSPSISPEAAGKPDSDAEEPPPPPPPPVPVFEPASAPTLQAVTTHSMLLHWEPVMQTGVSGAPPGDCEFPPCGMAYLLESRKLDVEGAAKRRSSKGGEPEDSPWETAYKGTENYVQLTNVRPGRRYAFRVTPLPVAFPPLGPAPPQAPSAEVVFCTPPTAPSAPQPPTLTARARNNLAVKWLDPEETGGREISAYYLQMAPPPQGMEHEPHEEGFVEVYQGREQRAKVPRLAPGHRYAFRVKAQNVVGVSPWSLVAAFATQASVPGVPDPPVAASAGPTSALVRWAAPPDNGAPVTHYQLERDDGIEGEFNFVYGGAEPFFEAQGLKSGLVYRFRVQAFNDEGKSHFSAPGLVRTAAVAPGPPPQPKTIGATRTSASVAWAAPSEDGGAPVLGYEVEMQPKSKAAVVDGLPQEWVLVYQGEGTACTLGGLRAGCTYLVRVRARNATGMGQYSAAADVATAGAPPDAPAAPVPYGRFQDAIHLEWTRPAHDGGAEVTGYRLEMCRAGPAQEGLGAAAAAALAAKGKGKADLQYESIYSGDAQRVELQALEPGTEYLFRIAATNAHGASPLSSPCSVCTRPAAPCAPDPPHLLSAAAAALRLGWAEPYSPGASVTSYQLEMARCAAAPHAAPSANGAGPQQQNGRHTNEMQSCVANGVHELLAAFAEGSHSASEARSASESVTGSEAASSSDADAARLAFASVYQGAATSCEVKGLEPFTEYLFRVRAANVAGCGEWSALQRLRTAPAPPSPPRHLCATGASSASVRLSWAAPEQDHGAPVSAYAVEYAPLAGKRREPAAWAKGYSGPQLACEVEGLRAGRQYLFRARAANAKGPGAWTASVSVETEPAPPAPPGAPAFSQRSATGVRVRWEAVEEDNGAPVLKYRLEMSDDGGRSYRAAYTGPDTLFRAGGLQPGRTYLFRVSAANAVGDSAPGPSAPVATARAPPPPPGELHAAEAGVAADGRAALLLRWQLPQPSAESSHADVASVEVEASPAPGAESAPAAGGARCTATASGKAAECQLAGLLPGTEYQVRARCVGADGAGHGAWSAPVTARTAGTRQTAQAPAKAACLDSPGSADAASGGASRRRGKRGEKLPEPAVGVAKRAPRTKGAAVAAVTKAPPRKRASWRSRLWKWGWMFALAVAICAGGLFLRYDMAHNAAKTRAQLAQAALPGTPYDAFRSQIMDHWRGQAASLDAVLQEGLRHQQAALAQLGHLAAQLPPDAPVELRSERSGVRPEHMRVADLLHRAEAAVARAEELVQERNAEVQDRLAALQAEPPRSEGEVPPPGAGAGAGQPLQPDKLAKPTDEMAQRAAQDPFLRHALVTGQAPPPALWQRALKGRLDGVALPLLRAAEAETRAALHEAEALVMALGQVVQGAGPEAGGPRGQFLDAPYPPAATTGRPPLMMVRRPGAEGEAGVVGQLEALQMAQLENALGLDAAEVEQHIQAAGSDPAARQRALRELVEDRMAQRRAAGQTPLPMMAPEGAMGEAMPQLVPPPGV